MVLANDMVPTNTADYSAYILKIRSLKPDFVYLNLAGVDQTTFLKQYKEYNLPFPLAGGVMDTVHVLGRRPGQPVGALAEPVVPRPDGPGRAGVHQRSSRSSARRPTTRPGATTSACASCCKPSPTTKSHRRAASHPAPGEEAPTFDILKERKGSFRNWDHQLLQEMYVVKVKDKAQSKDKWDIFEVVRAVPGPKELAGADPADARRRIRAR